MAIVAGAGAGAAAQIKVESIMDNDPETRTPPARIEFSEKLLPLWLLALEQREADLRRETAQAIQTAHRRGMQGLSRAIPPLTKIIENQNEHPAVHLAAAQALAALEARQSAGSLLAAAKRGGMDMQQVIEPALARWKYQPAQDLWLSRLKQATVNLSSGRPPLRSIGMSRRKLILAIQGLQATGQTKAAPMTLMLAADSSVAPDVRMAAARAAAEIGGADPIPAARSLAARGARDLAKNESPQGMVDRLVAALLLSQSNEDSKLLLELAADSQGAVAAIAWKRLVELHSAKAAALAEQMIDDPDSSVRRLAAQSLMLYPSEARIALLAPRLDDPIMSVRVLVRESLFQLAQGREGPKETSPDLSQQVRRQAMEVLDAEPKSARWRGHEQAALLLGALNHKGAADRLIDLLTSPRSEAHITAAWALRQLAQSGIGPRILPAMLKHVQQSSQPGYSQKVIMLDQQIGQLLQAFGQTKYKPADAVLRSYLPKGNGGPMARGGAVWALGHIHADDPPPDLADIFQQRLEDYLGAMPETRMVRLMSAVGLGRIKARDKLPVLRKFHKLEGNRSGVGYACAWAIHQITGEPLPKVEPVVRYQTGWFLEPVD